MINLTLGTFNIPERDFYNYYSKVVEEHFPQNEDIFQELINTIDQIIEWYRSKIDNGPIWGVDHKGKKTLLNPEMISIPLLPDFGIKRHIYKSFFDEQIRTIEGIRLIYEVKKLLKEKDNIMNEIEKRSAESFLASFPISEGEILKFHLRKFERFKFTSSGIATIDGRELTDLERGLILCNTVPSEGIVEVQGEPDEDLFIDKMIHTIERDRLYLPEKIMVKADRYLKFLKNRKLSIEIPLTKKDEYDNRESGDTQNHLLMIPTRANQKQILDFWLRLTSNNEKGDPYWESEKEIEHFVYQNFNVFPGVTEIKAFNPNMNKSELYHVTWTFFNKYGRSKTKRQYENLLRNNFLKFKDGKDIYSNIKDQFNTHLKELLK